MPYKEDKKEILIGLDGGLKSLPDGTCDTIEQRENGVYLVQRIGKTVISHDTEITEVGGSGEFKRSRIKINIAGLPLGNYMEFITNSFVVADTVGDMYGYIATYDYGSFVFMFHKTDNIQQWLQANPTTIYYKLATPIETKLDLDTLNLETFKDKTYILSKNNIKPEIVCKAPVDVNQTIADLQGEQEQLIETYNTLKEENEAVKTAISELNEQEDVQTADMLDLDMRVLALEEGLE